MAITYNLPLKDWYNDETSIWTLDYPPLFAAFEYILALIAALLGLRSELELTSQTLRSDSIIIYQKLTVIFCDFVYYYAIYNLCRSIDSRPIKISNNNVPPKKDTVQSVSNKQNLVDAFYRPDTTTSIAILLLFQPCLLLVDHIHFQYNGFLSGIFLLAVAAIINEQYVSATFWFAILVCLKHIYLYCAPAFGLYVVFSHCLARPPTKNSAIFTRPILFVKKSTKLGLVTIFIIMISFLPFAMDTESLTQVLKRLFPFKRGLTHAYWAPNIWAIYNLVDKVMFHISPPMARFDMDTISRSRSSASTSGLVQEYEHQYLPSISPSITFALVGIATVPLIIIFSLNIGKISRKLFLKGLTIAAFTSFLFGWHVHEKAILLVLLPMTPLALIHRDLSSVYMRLILTGTYSILPLLFKPAEYLTKMCVFFGYYSYCSNTMLKDSSNKRRLGQSKANKSVVRKIWFRLYTFFEFAIFWLIVLNEIYICLLHGKMNHKWNPLMKLNRFEYLPLLSTSCISAVGITFSYLELYYDFVFDPVVDEALAVEA